MALELGARALNSAPTAGEISFESALWIAQAQLWNGEADVALAGALDELNKYPLSIGQRWGFWDGPLRCGEGAMVARLVRGPSGAGRLAQVTPVRLGRYRQPFDAEREADWLAEKVDLTAVQLVLSGAKGWPILEGHYSALVAALSRRLGRSLEHQTYKERCGEFPSASGFGFARGVELARERQIGVLLYTLSRRGAKAACCLLP